MVMLVLTGFEYRSAQLYWANGTPSMGRAVLERALRFFDEMRTLRRLTLIFTAGHRNIYEQRCHMEPQIGAIGLG